MASYPNGQWPLSSFEEIGRGYDKYGLYRHLAPAGTAARWRELVRLGFEKYGVWLWISAGWNVYRPLEWQKVYRADLGIFAAVPGWSSHGGNFGSSDCMAIDVGNWRDLAPWSESLAWARFVALCRAVGFTVDFVSPRELWHIGDFNPWSVPQFASIVIKPATTNKPTPEEEEDDMRPTVHILINEKNDPLEAALVHPQFGVELDPYVGSGTGGRREEGVTVVRRGYITTRDPGRIDAWLRTYSKGIGTGTSRNVLEGRGNYRDILIAASAVSVEVTREASA